MLHRIGIVKSHKAEFIIKTLLGDASAPVNENQAAILDRFNRYVQLGDDIICDLRQNNGAIPKVDEFWNIVATYIDDKTAVDDRCHCSSTGEADVVVNMALATSLADIFRQCKQIPVDREPPVNVPTYTGRFEVKRMVQARLLRKENVDSHYTNAIYSFLKERASKHVNSSIMVSADAKCKISVGEPGFPIAAVTRGKLVVVGVHDYSKISLIPRYAFSFNP